MEKIYKLTESALFELVTESVNGLLRENAWSKYPEEDQNDAMLDMNMNDRTSGEWVDPYMRDDPMVKKIHGSTLRDMMGATLGSNIQPN